MAMTVLGPPWVVKIVGANGGLSLDDRACTERTTGELVDVRPGFSVRVRGQWDGTWREEVSGTTLTVSGSPTAASHPYAVSRRGLTFSGADASGQFITLPRSLFSMQVGKAATFGISFNLQDARSGASRGRSLFSNLAAGTAKGIQIGYAWDNTNSRNCAQIYVIDDFGGTAPNARLEANATPLDITNGAHTIIVSWDGVGRYGGLRIYVDGAVVWTGDTTDATTRVTNVDSLQDWVIAAAKNATNQNLPGTVGEVIVYPGVLPANECEALHRQLSYAGKRTCILSTDLYSDGEDVCALALAIGQARRGTWDLAAVLVDGAGTKGAPAAKQVLGYYGMPQVPVGQYQGTAQAGLTYASLWTVETANNAWGNGVAARAAEDRTTTAYTTPTTTLVNALNTSENGACTLIMTGFAECVNGLWAANKTLFSSKVSHVIAGLGAWSGAAYLGTDRPEYNAQVGQEGWFTFLAEIPAAVPVFSYDATLLASQTVALFVGQSVAFSTGNPAAFAFGRFNQEQGYVGSAALGVLYPREIWDSALVLMAVNPRGVTWSGLGRISVANAAPVFNSGGAVSFEAGATGYQHRYQLGSQTALRDAVVSRAAILNAGG